jgi:hypothetical protein
VGFKRLRRTTYADEYWREEARGPHPRGLGRLIVRRTTCGDRYWKEEARGGRHGACGG